MRTSDACSSRRMRSMKSRTILCIAFRGTTGSIMSIHPAEVESHSRIPLLGRGIAELTYPCRMELPSKHLDIFPVFIYLCLAHVRHHVCLFERK